MNEEFRDIDYDIMFSSPEEMETELFDTEIEDQQGEEMEVLPSVPIREVFPEVNSNYSGGTSDGFVYRSVFVAKNAELTYNMILAFLEEEGYADVPKPKDIEELLLFRIPTRNKQILLFEDNGYVHNPIKILFPDKKSKRTTLILEIYNETAEKHLLRFHRKGGF